MRSSRQLRTKTLRGLVLMPLAYIFLLHSAFAANELKVG
jgi:hypothetical protein